MILIVVNTALFVPAILWELNNFGFLFTVATNAVLRVLWMEASARKTALYYRLSSKLFLVGRYFLFGLIGVAVDLRSSDASVLRLVVAVVITGMIFRGFTAFLVNSCCEKMPPKSRASVAFMWLGKATVQVAAGGLVSLKESHFDNLEKEFGEHFEALSVLAILMCAPTAGVLGGSLAKRWLPVGEIDKSSFASKSTVTPEPDSCNDSEASNVEMRMKDLHMREKDSDMKLNV